MQDIEAKQRDAMLEEAQGEIRKLNEQLLQLRTEAQAEIARREKHVAETVRDEVLRRVTQHWKSRAITEVRAAQSQAQAARRNEDEARALLRARESELAGHAREVEARATAVVDASKREIGRISAQNQQLLNMMAQNRQHGTMQRSQRPSTPLAQGAPHGVSHRQPQHPPGMWRDGPGPAMIDESETLATLSHVQSSVSSLREQMRLVLDGAAAHTPLGHDSPPTVSATSTRASQGVMAVGGVDAWPPPSADVPKELRPMARALGMSDSTVDILQSLKADKHDATEDVRDGDSSGMHNVLSASLLEDRVAPVEAGHTAAPTDVTIPITHSADSSQWYGRDFWRTKYLSK